MRKNMTEYAAQAIKELKESGEWNAYEEHISYEYDRHPMKQSSRSSSRVIILIILRGESPEVILVKLNIEKGSVKNQSRILVEEIKQQIKSYFTSDAHRRSSSPEAFTIPEALHKNPEL